MNKIDLIIDALDNFLTDEKFEFDKLKQALSAAHELKALKPVGTFAYDSYNKVWEQLIEGVRGVELYDLDEEQA